MTYIQRDIEKDIENWIEEREIIAIRGPRQAGKTTLLMRIKEKLFNKRINEKNIIYLSFEDDLLRIAFEENPKKFVSAYLGEDKVYFLLDEVQYIKDVGRKLKLIFDSFNNIKLIITGSSSFDLTNLGKYLVGRVIFFDLYPFNFFEFLKAKGERYEKIYSEYRFDIKEKKIEKNPFLEELNNLFKEYLSFGSYPRVVLADNNKKNEILKNIFITYIEKDIISLYGNKYRDEIIKLMQILASTKGIIKYESLASDSKLNFNELKKILSILQDSFAISIVSPFHKNLITELKKNPKIYFIDYGLRNYLANKVNLDILYENFIYNEMTRKYNVKYWRTTAKTEIDFIIQPGQNNDLIPIEVKTTPKITRALRSFIETYKPSLALIANLDKLSKDKVNQCDVISVPFVHL
ncbi:ATP-binding protein [Candidatus Pacearchaeota archaeon]|nr:ATP-binding protein [Candidatus Pacearchaeota archaeon]